MASKPRGLLYIGVTAKIAGRVWQHGTPYGSGHCRRYGIDKLVHVEHFPTILEAIAREKQLKNWLRTWKLELIERDNPDWSDLREYLFSGLDDRL